MNGSRLDFTLYSPLVKPMVVYVLLFNARTENEGIHSLKMGDHNIVLAFEDEDDATRYALLLEAQDFMSPSVEALDREEVEEFCQSVQYDCQFIPKGFIPQNDFERLLLAPPEVNLDSPDWDPDSEPDQESQVLEAEGPPDDRLASSNPELDRIRRQLEGLI
jgi:hypothetical protein